MARKPSPLDESLCLRARSSFRNFFAASVIQNEATGALGQQAASSMQHPLFRALDEHSWWLFGKPRQSHVSTFGLLWLLQGAEYTPGLNALCITNKQDTSDELFDRLLTAHHYQPPEIKVPMTRAGLRGVQFSHRGKVKVATAGGEDPTIGFSIDRLLGSEWGMWPNAGPVLSKLIPTLAKRPHARVLFESTPGNYGSPQHDLWLRSLAGETRFKTMFIAWWKHPGYARPLPKDFAPDNEELRLIEKYGMSFGHLQFRREMLATACSGDSRLFSNQYPFDEVDGWITTRLPALPEAPIKELLSTAQTSNDLWELPKVGTRYMLVADPNAFGETGDPSAWTLFNLQERREVGAWSGRMDPLLLADELAKLGKRYNNALIVVESNAAACIAALIKGGYPCVWQDEKDTQAKPGWWATANDKERAIGALCRLLNRKDMKILSRAGLLQLLAYDGSGKRKEGHHFDRVVTYYIAADMLERLNIAPLRPPPERRTPDGAIRLKPLMAERNTRSPV